MLALIRLAFVLGVIVWIGVTSPVPVTIAIAFLFLRVELGNYWHDQHRRQIGSCAEAIRTVANEVADGFIAVLNQRSSGRVH
jgi:hypothetical protein